MDFERARNLMSKADIDALLVIGPENVSYVTGAPIGPVHMWRSFGPYLAIVPSDPSRPTSAVVADSHERIVSEAGIVDQIHTHPAWIEYTDITRYAGPNARARIQEATRHRDQYRPELYDLDLISTQLQSALKDLGVFSGRIGVEYDHLRYSDMRMVQSVLPTATLVDSSSLFRELRVLKSRAEVDHLRTAVHLTEHGIQSAVKSSTRDSPIAHVALAYREGVIQSARERGLTNLVGSWDIISIGDRPWSNPTSSQIAEGDLIKFDCGCTVSGYTADMGRTFVVGKPSSDQLEIYDALQAGMTAALGTMEPGNPCSAVFEAAESAVHRKGFTTYTRGHFGHSIGSTLAHEEWPWLSRTETRLIEPNMVFAVETPYYIDGIGGFMLEHNVVVRENSLEFLDSLPDTLESIS